MEKYNDLSDEELIVLLKKSDEQALSALYFRYWDKLLSVAVRRLDDLTEAEEIVQDIFINVWDRRGDLELKYRFETYLAVAVKYRVINRLDHNYRKRMREANAFLPAMQSLPSSEELVLEKELMARLEVAIKKLPEKCRVIYRMSREEGKTNRQIGEELGLSEKTVEGHMTKALKNLRGSLSTFMPLIIAGLIEKL